MSTAKLNATLLSHQNKVVGNLIGCSLALEIAKIKAQKIRPLVVICTDSYDVYRLEQDLKTLAYQEKVYTFPDYETLPYDRLSPHQDIISRRLEMLSILPNLNNGIIVTSLTAIVQRLSPINYIQSNSFVVKVGDLKDLESLRTSFIEEGYIQVEQVLAHGEFAVRGSILDIFPMGSKMPIRLDFFDDEIESISYIDIQSQRSIKKLNEIKLLPAAEFPLDKDSITLFRSQYRNSFVNTNFSNHIVYKTISQGAVPAGIEYYLPLFFNSTNSFFDYLREDTGIVLVGDFTKAAQDYNEELHKRAKLFIGSPEHPPLPVETLFLNPNELNANIAKFEKINLLERELTAEECTKRGSNNALVEHIPDIALDHHNKNTTQKFQEFALNFCTKQKGRILITALSEGRRQSLRELIPESLIAKLQIKVASNTDEFIYGEAPFMISTAPFDKGCLINATYINTSDDGKETKHTQKIAFITETELLGFKVVRQRRRKHQNSNIEQDAIIKNLSQLQEGQIVVHIDHGIGRYCGLKTEVINGIKGEYLTIEYKDGDMLSIPITSLNKVARYSGQENPPLSKIGSDAWGKKKNKAAEKVRDIAAELLDIYAQRELKKGFAYKINRKALEEFTSSFPYEETEDQQKAIEETLRDMAKPVAMDRLICGDVGFGKTEVALRAAFVAAMNGKQVAILAPTTILAQQHYENFKERFASTPIIIEMLSRFCSSKEQNEAIKKIEQGTIDIIIGTHRLLSKNIKFKDLGLLIIDEEHRFGVRQKEVLKAKRTNVDLLTLTATPIPRTLNMALEGMRELSIIATPPEHRLAVKTFIYEKSDQHCREAVLRELKRGGQIYYLHNEVATMNATAEHLAQLVPEAKIGIAHGQMDKYELQKVMQDFYNQRFNLLLCSTIIENGLDIPTANTIIIDRADLLGLAQLHQIRGRVGRSHHQAYAYFFTPSQNLLTKEAKQRLEAISSIDDLGAGFVLASHDLEIRGAGELLGEDQSGQIEAVGFSLYMDMLNTAVKALKEGREPSLHELTLNECDIDMHLPAIFPESYIGDVNTRLSLYKRLASCITPNNFTDLKIELIDRFGNLPKESENLFIISQLKQIASAIGITKIRGDEKGATLEFSADHKVDPRYLLSLIQRSKHNEYKITSDKGLRYNLPESEKNPRLQILKSILNALYVHSSVVQSK